LIDGKIIKSGDADLARIIEKNGYEKSSIKNNSYTYGFHKLRSLLSNPFGINEKIVKAISAYKNESLWMKEFRLRALNIFEKKKMPSFGPDLSKLNFDKLCFYNSPSIIKFRKWSDVPKDILDTYNKIGVPEAERNFWQALRHNTIGSNLFEFKNHWEKLGVIFTDMDTAVKEYPEWSRSI